MLPMFKKIMASLGVGAAKVNLILDDEQCRIGKSIKGRIVIEGGNVDQEIKTLDVDVVLRFTIKGKEFTRVVDTIKIARDFNSRAKETRELPFDYYLPVHYPISKGSLSYYLITRMDISRAVDTNDTDKLVVLPSREMAVILEAMDNLGFREKIGSGKIGKHGQEFEYYPTKVFAEQLKELEFKFYSEDRNIKMFLELELTGGYFRSGAEHHTELAIPPELLARGSVKQVADFIRESLEKELKQVSLHGARPIANYQDYHHHHHHGASRPGFGGFMGGMVTGLLGGALLSSLFDVGEGEGTDAEADMSGGEGGDEGGFDFGLGDLFGGGDFGDGDF